MKLPENTSGGTFEKCPAGNHLAVCYEVIDLGTQETNYGMKRQVWIGWETPHEQMEDGRPYVIGKPYTFSANEKSTLRQHLEAWRGRPFKDKELAEFEVQSLIGRGCFLNVVHNERDDRTYANIQSVAQLPKGTEAPEPVNEKLFFCMEPGEFDPKVFDKLSDRMKDKICKSPEFAKVAGDVAGEMVPPASVSAAAMPAVADDGEDIPF